MMFDDIRNRIGRSRGFGGCGRCGGTWDHTKPHETFFTATKGCFPLCEVCWDGLETYERRLPYYFDLAHRHAMDSPDQIVEILDEFELIKAALKAES